MSLELAAMRWLWIEQKCLVVLQERAPKYGMGQPDVLGVTPGRYLTEIEIKRSRADFKADFKKPHRASRNLNGNSLLKLTSHPRQFYYLMPKPLAEELELEIPDWAGLMMAETAYVVTVLKKAPVNKESTKLNVKQCARLARQMTAHMMGFVIANNSIREAHRKLSDFEFTDWVDADVGTYTI